MTYSLCSILFWKRLMCCRMPFFPHFRTCCSWELSSAESDFCFYSWLYSQICLSNLQILQNKKKKCNSLLHGCIFLVGNGLEQRMHKFTREHMHAHVFTHMHACTHARTDLSLDSWETLMHWNTYLLGAQMPNGMHKHKLGVQAVPCNARFLDSWKPAWWWQDHIANGNWQKEIGP